MGHPVLYFWWWQEGGRLVALGKFLELQEGDFVAALPWYASLDDGVWRGSGGERCVARLSWSTFLWDWVRTSILKCDASLSEMAEIRAKLASWAELRENCGDVRERGSDESVSCVW